MASILKIADAWRAQIRRKGHPTIARTFTKKSHAEAWAHKIEEELRAGEFSDTRGLSDFTLGDLIDRYVNELGKLKPFGRSKAATIGLLNRNLGDVRLSDLTPQRLVEFSKTRNAGGAGMVTVSMDLTYLSGILKFAKSLWRIPLQSNIVEDAREILKYMGLVGKSKQRDRRPTQTEIDTLCTYFDTTARAIPIGELIRFAIATAMRAGEISNLLWSDLNITDKTIIIRDRKHPSEKLGNDQTVPLLSINGLDAFEIAMRQPKTDKRIFPYNSDSIASIFPRACEKLGIIDLHFHDFRHEGGLSRNRRKFRHPKSNPSRSVSRSIILPSLTGINFYRNCKTSGVYRYVKQSKLL